MSMSGSPDHSRAPDEEKNRERHRKRQGKISKGAEEHSVAMNKHKILNGGHKRTLPSGPKERKARKACQKAVVAFRRWFSPFPAK